ncbi:MAG: hypothetical protein JO362_22800 [Streptomycetaceae bacterium]|nr:hypothetical protein [Streptomycetaceae bacterium]
MVFVTRRDQAATQWGLDMAIEIRVRIARSMDQADVNEVHSLAEAAYPGRWKLTPVESAEPTLGVADDLLIGLVDGTTSFLAHEICQQIKSWLAERSRRYPTPPEIEVEADIVVPADPPHDSAAGKASND